MLGKLIKYEWKSSFKLIFLMNLFILLITLIGSVSSLARPRYGESRFSLAMLGLTFYYISILVVSAASVLYIAYRFYKNYYSDEGYLMHTLPVTPHQLILSKLIVSFVHMLITSLVIFISIVALGFSTYYSLSAEVAAKISAVWVNEFVPEFSSIFPLSLPTFILYFIIGLLIGNVYSILLSYGSISLGQLFTKHKLMASILCYIGVSMLAQTAIGVACTPFFVMGAVNVAGTSEFMNRFSSFFTGLLVLSIVLSAVLSAVFYFLTHYIMSKKLNLE